MVTDGGFMSEEKTDEFKKHEEITKNFMEKVEAKDATKAKEESSASDKPKEEKTKGDEAKKSAEQAEEKAQEDEKILDTPEDQLDEGQKTRKAELLKTKKEKEESSKTDEQKKKEGEKKEEQDKLDKRFAELTNEIKHLKVEKGSDKDKIGTLEKELAGIKEKQDRPVKEKTAKDAEQEKIKKFIEEDKDKPPAERREMSKADLEEWLLEDNVAAQEWLADRSVRRSDDRKAAAKQQVKEKYIKELVNKMSESSKRVEEKHPELNTKAREDELRAEGKNDKEINAILIKENKKYSIMMDIMKENPNKYIVENGPELMEKELVKRLGTPEKKENKTSFTDEELAKIKEDARKEAIEEEKERQSNIDEGNTSTQGKTKKTKTKMSPEMDKKLSEILKRTGTSREQFDKAAERSAKFR